MGRSACTTCGTPTHRLLAGAADLQVVKERLGHSSIATTERYLHTLPTADDTALDALANIRRGSAPVTASR